MDPDELPGPSGSGLGNMPVQVAQAVVPRGLRGRLLIEPAALLHDYRTAHPDEPGHPLAPANSLAVGRRGYQSKPIWHLTIYNNAHLFMDFYKGRSRLNVVATDVTRYGNNVVGSVKIDQADYTPGDLREFLANFERANDLEIEEYRLVFSHSGTGGQKTIKNTSGSYAARLGFGSGKPVKGYNGEVYTTPSFLIPPPPPLPPDGDPNDIPGGIYPQEGLSLGKFYFLKRTATHYSAWSVYFDGKGKFVRELNPFDPAHRRWPFG